MTDLALLYHPGLMVWGVWSGARCVFSDPSEVACMIWMLHPETQ